MIPVSPKNIQETYMKFYYKMEQNSKRETKKPVIEFTKKTQIICIVLQRIRGGFRGGQGWAAAHPRSALAHPQIFLIT